MKNAEPPQRKVLLWSSGRGLPMADDIAEFSTTEGRRIVKLELNAQAVINPALIAMRDSLEMIAISLNALKDTDLKKIPVIPYCFNNFKFNAPDNEDPDERRAALTCLSLRGPAPDEG